MSEPRRYTVGGRSTGTFGRVLVNARNHHFVVDGPVENGCPGEAITPVEQFLAGVAACGVELIEVIARTQDIPLRSVRSTVHGEIDREKQAHAGVTTLSRVRVGFELDGVDDAQAAGLVEAFKGR